MKQFNLDTWLQDKSRKVVTRDGREVRIICTDRNSRSGNIVGLVGKDESLIYVWNNDGKHIVSEIPDNDLFFADEEDGLTEFEKELVDLVSGWCDSHVETPEEYISKHSRKLLDLARKELIPIQDAVAYHEGVKEGRRLERQDIDKELDEAYKSRDEIVYLEGYDQGKEDALNDLQEVPKLEKTKDVIDPTIPIVYTNTPSMKTYVEYNGYRLCIHDAFEKLPKNE